MKEQLKEILLQCGKKIIPFFGVEEFSLKEDSSPVTEADKVSHQFLMDQLKKIKDVPILSEECPVGYEHRKNWKEFWLVDPLDGTKEFINGDKEFCILVSLIRDKKPVLGTVYAPALHEFYYAEEGKGMSFDAPNSISDFEKEDEIISVKSRFHHSEATQKFLSENNLEKTKSTGSALKFCRLALGKADLYPRFEGSKEWDIAAGHLILKEAGGSIIDLSTGQEPTYNKPSIRNNFFVAGRKGIDLQKYLNRD